MAFARKKLNAGGLWRCCIATWDSYEGEEDEGTVLPCKNCSSSLIVKDGWWQWNPDDPVESDDPPEARA